MTSMCTEIRTIINQHPDNGDLLLSVIDKNGTLFYVNAEMRRVLDTRNGLKTIVNLFDQLSPDRVDDFRITIQKSAKTGMRQVADLTVKNGEDHFINLQVHPVEDETLQKQLFFCIGKEVRSTVVKQGLHDQISIPSILYKSFLQQMPDMTWAIDDDEILVFANDAFLEYFNLCEKDLQRHVSQVLPEKVIAAFYTKHTDVLKHNKKVQTIQKVQLADGTDKSFSVTIFPIETTNGKKIIGGHAAVMQGQQLEEELRVANEHILLLTRVTTDAIWEWDMKKGTIFRNDVLMNLIGFTLDESKGLAWWLRRIHPEDRNRVGDKVKEVTEKGLQTWEDEYRIKCSDGDYKHIHDHGYIVYENGLPVKMIGSLRDVSELKSLRTELHQEKIKRQQELSETVINVQELERTRIAYELHDNINQVMSTAKLFVDMLTPTGKRQEKLKQQGIDYLVMAIEDIRRLSKDLVVPQLKEKGLVESISTLIDDINISGKLQIKFTHDLESDLVSVARKVTLFRILQEQLKNIIKSSGADKAEVYLHCKANAVKMIIKDNGVGFDSGHTERGIGLSNIYERTRFYNGTVKIDTAPGKGCTMEIDIPFES